VNVISRQQIVYNTYDTCNIITSNFSKIVVMVTMVINAKNPD